ncbi:MAG: hypothetical protein ACM3X1_08500 [Ignavibacteriales bacterium]
MGGRESRLRKLLYLRSWVQLPPGPFLSTREPRYQNRLVLGSCRTNPATMPVPCDGGSETFYDVVFIIEGHYYCQN